MRGRCVDKDDKGGIVGSEDSRVILVGIGLPSIVAIGPRTDLGLLLDSFVDLGTYSEAKNQTKQKQTHAGTGEAAEKGLGGKLRLRLSCEDHGKGTGLEHSERCIQGE